jgi:hypothetical protein
MLNLDRRCMIVAGVGMHILHCDVAMLTWMMIQDIKCHTHVPWYVGMQLDCDCWTAVKIHPDQSPRTVLHHITKHRLRRPQGWRRQYVGEKSRRIQSL